jgi:hypothetical protein
MSVDYNECEYCYESRIDDNCYTRIINNKSVCVCNYCINDEIKNGNLIKFDKYSDNYNLFTEKDKKIIQNYNSIYKYTNQGKQIRLNEIDKELNQLQKEKDELLKT